MQALQRTSLLDGGNGAYLESLYESYLQDPDSVDDHWRNYFDALPRVNGHDAGDVVHSELRREFSRLTGRLRGHRIARLTGARLDHERKQVRVLQLINAYRFRGHQHAKTDPLRRADPALIPELDLAYHELSEVDFDTVFNTGSLVGADEAKLEEILLALNKTYCGTVGAEYMHMQVTEEKRWVQQHLESVQSHPSLSNRTRKWLLNRLTAAEGLERYLHSKYVGQKRFSLEGAESLIPMLDEVIERSGSQGMQEVVIGMSHRGRLNVLINVLGKSPSVLFSEFEGKNSQQLQTGDVKYHQGFSTNLNTSGGQLHLTLAFNPSHLEIVSPVVEGSVRARQQRYTDNVGDKVLPVVIHGDSAFAGQGVVMETFNMSGLRGFSTHGTVHIIINNQIGFTTSTRNDTRSMLYCSDVAKMVGAPIFHVNGDDPEAVLFVARLALGYRQKFKKDVVIDLVCYRRHGHNEADEPAATQPIMYGKIRKHKTTRELYAERLVDRSVVAAADAARLQDEYRDRLDRGEPVPQSSLGLIGDEYTVDWAPYLNIEWDIETDTTISPKRVAELGKAITTIPPDVRPHGRVQRILDDRIRMANGEAEMDWGFAETMAYASLLADGHIVRLVGQDSGRGTFFHRHAVIHNQLNNREYIPLQTLTDRSDGFRVIDSLLSEEAVLGFEYGYASTSPDTLVIWEGQFGDFANGAQVVIDQFISSGEAKWGRLCGLTMLLPHGYEGQGPEHSSARLERFLQLCAEHNIQVCVPSTPAQMFHMLRRQQIRPFRKPLIVMTPKSLLRHKMSVSKLEMLSDG